MARRPDVIASVVTVERRSAVAGDVDLLRALFVGARPELALLPPEIRADMLDLQFRAQRSQYAASYPDARQEVVVADGAAVGQLLLDDSSEVVRVVDVSVEPAHRGIGIGSAVLRHVVAEAHASGRAVRLSVWSENAAAQRLYASLGFETVVPRPGPGHVEMVCPVPGEEETS
jgi:ribosomal protein S18 acetylase RimI-like enzyme